MRTLSLIGIGTGNPEHMTVQGINALNRADVILIPRKGEAKEDLADLRRVICERFLENRQTRIVEFDLPARDAANPSYRRGVDDWHMAIARAYGDLLAAHTGETGRAAFLVWGDPSLYDSTLRIIEHMRREAGLDVALEVVPGITSIQAFAASHHMPINTIGGSILITTGRRLKAEGFPPNADTLLVMLDGDCAFQMLDGDAYEIYWGAYLGTPDELLIAGPLGDVAGQIVEARVRAREDKGWIMDTYLLRVRG
ncbi:precorrin-6A synthase (deacetylating) [Nitratireductor aquimarinus]|uniref:precorrin-6A synthase (deacetylating) n=1 Tax=Alphaproteobacteria TaxID=28211 RepID=UPI0019D397BA|nr:MULTISPECIES: precorrin-6A synthase (deacetylating) [Alphaproteobacteria]MBN7758908.1 precorrin-6A synthase (deacetylating) [Nitratireductor aquimarinus]MBY6001909.1 precorrin-6A synthase (deacetylating) [Tritonibacter mobilis]MBY6024194.1 precorrin-6A synthase (deacetylating) [Nitratireductor sp. DP7N14-4]